MTVLDPLLCPVGALSETTAGALYSCGYCKTLMGNPVLEVQLIGQRGRLIYENDCKYGWIEL